MALYLKYRPQDFENLVWQDFIKNTIKKSIKDNKTVWAYLFCWPRASWKTSSARIFAKAINCTNNIDWNPCNKCYICNEINKEKLIDIIEIDAASHTGVDNIRDIIEKAQFLPSIAKYKVYIIDEVHMLSKWAFNALLKILEEPPKHVKFVLATTETHKVLDTIISRCQKFDFKSISYNDIKNRLLYIKDQENISIDDESLDYIINSSWWWLRNAISLFEQLIIDGEIKFEKIITNLWIVSRDKIKSFYNKLINKDLSIIKDYEELINEWKNIKLFFKDLFFFIIKKSKDEYNNKDNLKNNIILLDIIEDSFIKAKNSIDENSRFLIWILQIIKEDWVEYDLNKKFEQENNNNIKIDKKFEQEVKDEKINNNIVENLWYKETNNNNIIIIDKDKFIEKMKELKIKWWLILSIKWSSFNLNKDILTINFNTEFSLKQSNTSSNIEILTNILKDMWHSDIKIILKSIL